MPHNYYYCAKSTQINELIAKLKPYGIEADSVDWVPGMIDYIILHGGDDEKMFLFPDHKYEGRIQDFHDCAKWQGELVDDVWIPKSPTTILNAIREVVGELLTEEEVEQRLEQARTGHNAEAVAYWEHVYFGDSDADDRWFRKCAEMYPDRFGGNIYTQIWLGPDQFQSKKYE
jgi:hypothetical protein